MNKSTSEKVVTEKVVNDNAILSAVPIVCTSGSSDEYSVELPICVQAAAWGVTFATVAYTATALVKLFSKD